MTFDKEMRACNPLRASCVRKDCGRQLEGGRTFLSGGQACYSTAINYNSSLTTNDCGRLYRRSRALLLGDIALSSSLQTNETQAACLPDPMASSLTTRCYVTWYRASLLDRQMELQRRKVLMYTTEECRRKFPDLNVTDDMLCVSLATEVSPVCDINQNDDVKGLAVQCLDVFGLWTVVGIQATIQPYGCRRDNGEENPALFYSITERVGVIRGRRECPFSCDDRRVCLPAIKVCDGIPHCLDRSDETDVCNVSCTFEDPALCGFREVTDGMWELAKGTDTVPDHTLKRPGGHYLVHRSGNTPVNTTLVSPAFTASTQSCFEFYYYMPWDSANLTAEILEQSSNMPESVLTFTNRQGPKWRLGQMDLQPGTYRVHFIAYTAGGSAPASVSIDDTILRQGPCLTTANWCGGDEFECDSGQCIMLEDACNTILPSCPNTVTHPNCTEPDQDGPVVVTPTSSDVRLVNGPSSAEGRVEILHNGVWGTICDDGWDRDDASVICRMLGYRFGTAFLSARYGRGSGQIWLDDVGCAGTERHISLCRRRTWGNHNCGHSEDAGVRCSNDPVRRSSTTTRVRLIGGSNSREGRVEVFHSGSWGTVCDDSWGNSDATVICRMLGYSTGVAFVRAHFGRGTGRIWLDNVRCVGDEEDIANCRRNSWGDENCSHSEDAGVACSQPLVTNNLRPRNFTVDRTRSVRRLVRLMGGVNVTEARNASSVGGTAAIEGRLEVLIGEVWGTVCDDRWGTREANVACRTLGFFRGERINLGRFGPGNGPIWMDDVQCTEQATDIFTCTAAPYGRHDCDHYEDVALACEGCAADELLCDASSRCVNASSRCDGIPQCLDGTDEDNCTGSLLLLENDVSLKVSLRDDDVALISLDNQWYPVCYNESHMDEIAGSFCSAFTTSGTLGTNISRTNVSQTDATESGMVLFTDSSTSGLRLGHQQECYVMRVQCQEPACGVKGMSGETTFVSGGMESGDTEWPWYLAILNDNGGVRCSAILVAPTWVLTHTLCVDEPISQTVRMVGGTNLTSSETLFEVKRLVKSPPFQFLNYDLVLIEVMPINTTRPLQPVCLPDQDTVFPEYCFALSAGPFGNSATLVLRKSRVRTYNQSECHSHNPSIWPSNLSRLLACAVSDDAFRDNCQANVGDPVVCKTSSNRWVVKSLSHNANYFGCNNHLTLPGLNNIEIGLWDMWISETLAAECMMNCEGKCIYRHELCNGVSDCLDNSDETIHCGGPTNCTFAFNSSCGFNVSQSRRDGWFVSYHHSTNSYRLVARSTGSGERRIILSQEFNETSATESCLRITGYIVSGSVQATAFNGLRLLERLQIMENTFNGRSTIWRRGLPLGTTRIQLLASGDASVSFESFVIENTPCGTGCVDKFNCGNNACLPKSEVCDGIVHCTGGIDEGDICESALNCTFEYNWSCGYNISTSDTGGWRLIYSRAASDTWLTVNASANFTDEDRVIVSANTTEPAGMPSSACLNLTFWITNGSLEVESVNGSRILPGAIRVSSTDVVRQWYLLYHRLAPGTTNIRLSASPDALLWIDNITVVESCPSYGIVGGLFECTDDQFDCGQKQCIRETQVCDSRIDCPGSQDEGLQCSKCDPITQFQCHNGLCVPASSLCDDTRDCLDGSDEFNCTACSGLVCDRGATCVRRDFICDGFRDCGDSADEIGCDRTCSVHQCNNSICLQEDFVCNGDDDCGDGSDEAACLCTDEERACADGRCIPESWFCDRFADCADASDERNCSACGESARACRNFACVPQEAWCNGTAECADGSDENNCVRLMGDTLSGGVRIATGNDSSLPVCPLHWNNDTSDSVCRRMGHVRSLQTTSVPSEETDFFVLREEVSTNPGLLLRSEKGICPTQEEVHVTCSPKGCGRSLVSGPRYHPFIVGGEMASEGSWPWVALLYYLNKPRCGATVIADQWLVTAAHCVREKRLPARFKVLAGAINRGEPGSNGQFRAIDKIYVHPNFSTSRDTLPYDIALLRLSSPLLLTSYVQPLCLPETDTVFPLTTTCFVAGFGTAVRQVRVIEQKMREAKLKLYSDDSCMDAYRNRIVPRDKLCAGYDTGIISPCFGDSGGPLMCEVGKNQWTLAGIISVGERNCRRSSGEPVKPTAFSRLTTYVDWITQTIQLATVP